MSSNIAVPTEPKDLESLWNGQIEPTVWESVINLMSSQGGAAIDVIVSKSEYQPKDPPTRRRNIMSRTVAANQETVMKATVFLLSRGGNPARCWKGMDESTKIKFESVFKVLKIKDIVPGSYGLYSTWQWMTSFWDYSVIAVSASNTLQNKLGTIGGKRFKNVLPIYCYVPGGCHLFVGVADDMKTKIKNEMFKYQHFCIEMKRRLANKPTPDQAMLDRYRMNQSSYLDYQLTEGEKNFTTAEAAIVWKLLNVNMQQHLTGIKFSEHDYLLKPNEADERDFCQ